MYRISRVFIYLSTGLRFIFYFIEAILRFSIRLVNLVIIIVIDIRIYIYFKLYLVSYNSFNEWIRRKNRRIR